MSTEIRDQKNGNYRQSKRGKDKVMLSAPRETKIDTPQSTSSATGVLVSLSLAMLLSSLGTSIANVALPSLSKAFGASFQDLQWVVLAYLLSVTVLIVSVGRLGDLIGRKRMLLAGLWLFMGSSILCGTAPVLWWLVAARGIQGLGAAILMAFALAFVGETIPKERMGSAMGLLGSMSAIGTALGPSLGGFLITSFGWRAIFFVNLPLGILALWFTFRFLPFDRPKQSSARESFDFGGMLVMAGTLTAYALAMTLGRGAFGMLNVALLFVALVGAVVFLIAEERSASPLLRIRLFRDCGLSLPLAMSAGVSTVLMATLIVGPFYLTRALGQNAVMAGALMSVGPIVVSIAGLLFGRLVDHYGAHRMTSAGLIGIAIGSLALAILPLSTGIAGYVAPIVIITLGYALFQTANNTAVMKEVAPEQRGVISGLVNLSRNLGLITGASAMGVVFAVASGVKDVASADPETVAVGFRATFIAATLLIVVLLAVLVGNGVSSPKQFSADPRVS